MQSKKISLPTYNVVATHGAAHSQEFEIECLVPKLGIQVYGRGGSRRAGEQAAAKLALDVAQQALVKTPGASRKSKPRAAQLKLAGIATIQSDGDGEGGPEAAMPPVPAPKAADTKAPKQTQPETKSA